MNSENLLSFIENKDPLDEKAISQIMLLIEKHPYFQLAHMLLLKALQNTNSEKYNKQLRISGSFISDKRKLFQFINSESLITSSKSSEKDETLKVAETNPDEKKVIKEEKTIVQIPVVKTEEKTIEQKKITIPETKVEIKSEVTVVKAEPEKKETVVRKKVDLSEEEIEQIANENSKIKHKEIIKDFFHSQGASLVEKKVIEPKKNETIQTKTAPIREGQKKVIAERRVVKEINFEQQEESKKEVQDIKTSLKDNNEKEKIESGTNAKIVEKEKLAPIEKIEIVERKQEIEKPTITKPRIETTETKKETVIKKVDEIKKEEQPSDTMSNIFSKIRQIKKEMNLSSESTPETIDVNKDEEPSKLLRSKKPEEKRTGRVIKESFIGFSDETSESTDDEKEETESVEEKDEIKESITAKDLFRQHLKKKEKSIYEESDLTNEKNDSDINQSPISKLVETVNEETVIKDEPIKTDKKETPPETKRTIEESKPTIKTESKPIEGETAADALLRRIAEKRKRIKEEQEQEEKRKKEEHQKELNAVNELIRSSNEEKKENETKKETPVTEQKTEIKINSETDVEGISPEKEKKSNKLIDSFIQKIDSLERLGTKESTLTGDISKSSTKESEEIMTETYADLLIQQKNYQKAIEVYNKLILKIPEKKTYFAIQIKKVESLIK